MRFSNKNRDVWRVPTEDPDEEWTVAAHFDNRSVGVFLGLDSENGFETALGAVWKDGSQWKCNVDGYIEIYTARTKTEAMQLCQTLIKLFDRETKPPY